MAKLKTVKNTSKISVVINTFNEEKNIERAIASVKNFADEIIVCDMESSDSTVVAARKMGAKIFKHKKVGYVEPARNFAISKAKNDWILILDADEEAQPGLLKKITEMVTTDGDSDFYRVPRKNIIFGKWIKNSRWWPDYNIRLFKKNFVSWNEVIHTVPMTLGKGSDFPADENLAIVHHNYDSVESYLDRMNRYTSFHSEIRIKEGYKFEWKDLITKPANEFFSRYFFGEGYKDGVHGLALSLLQSFSELALYLKIWQAEKFQNPNPNITDVISLMKNTEKEMHYWQNDSMFKESGKLTDRIRRKLRI